MTTARLKDKSRLQSQSWPLKGGSSADSTSMGRLETAASGMVGVTGRPRALYVLCRRGSPVLDTPIFEAGEERTGEAVAVFTDDDKALRYLQTAQWLEEEEAVPLAPDDFANWLEDLKARGIAYVAVNPDRRDHLAGKPQAVLILDKQVDWSGENLFREVHAVAP